jgi:hypothetical protein
MHEPVSKVQLEKHFKIPVYPIPMTPAQVAPPKEIPSHLSAPSRTLFPQTAVQSISFNRVHTVGQHPSPLKHEEIEVCAH